MSKYVPIEVKTHRDAYAATLHVLFKHIADFHLCVVKTFSKKYGIPEDEIIQTIQESPEFKNMEIDPALHTVHNDPVHNDHPVHNDAFESLGYKIDAITPPDTVPKKRIVKKNHTTDPPPIPAVARERESEQAPLLSQTDPNVFVSSEKKKVIKKTMAKNQAQAPLVAAPLVAAPLVAAPLVAAPLDDRIKPKIIKKQKTT